MIPCGSIMSGQRRELETIIPLSVLKLSTGSPAICQARTLTASPRIALSENTLEHGIFFAMHFLCQSFIQSCTQKNIDERTLARKWEHAEEISVGDNYCQNCSPFQAPITHATPLPESHHAQRY